MTNRGGAVAAFAALVFVGCGSKENATTGEPDPVIRMPSSDPKLCAPGRTEECPCVDGAHGVQTCNGKGTGYEPCSCPEPRGAEPVAPAPTTEPTPTPDPVCMSCTSQEDFDAAARKGRRCCPANLCSTDGQCTPRVCCRFPGGTMCADSPRCSAPNRVQKAPTKSRDQQCRDTCPGGEVSHCYCVCMGQCPND